MKHLSLLIIVGLAFAVALAQSSPPISLSIAAPKDHIRAGEKPWVTLTVQNLTREIIPVPDDQVYVEGEKGEPHPTPWQQLRKNRQLGGSFRDFMEPGESRALKYDLSAFYEFKPGKYTVYIEMLPETRHPEWNGGWIRSATAQLEIDAPSQ